MIKIPLIVDEKSARILDGQSRILNWAYNHLLEIANSFKKNHATTLDDHISKTIYSKFGLRNLLPNLKKAHMFLNAVHSSPLKNAALRLSSSIQDHQKGKKGKRKGDVTGWPKFRSIKKKFFSLYYDEPKKGFKIEGDILSLSLGKDEHDKRLRVEVKLKQSLKKFKNIKIKNIRVVKTGKIFSVCLCVERELPKKKNITTIASIDPNHKNLGVVVGNDGRSIEIKNPYFLRSLDRQIDQLKSRRDKCDKKSVKIELTSGKVIYKASRRWSYFNNILDDLYRRRREQTKTYLYTVVNKLFKQYDLIGIGDYTPHGGGINKGMRRAMNNGSLIGRFKDILKWVAERNGKHYMEWNERDTTKSCSRCNFKLPQSINPSVRTWVCPSCKSTHLRDENAAQNGLKKMYKNIKFPGSGHLVVINSDNRWAWKFDGLGIAVRHHQGPEAVIDNSRHSFQEVKQIAL